MSWGITSHASVNSGTSSAGNRATGSFTPTDNSRLFIFAAAERDGHLNARNWTISDTLSKTWTKLDESTLYQWGGGGGGSAEAFHLNSVCWYTDIVTGASMNVTVDASTGNEFYGVIAFSITGYDTGSPFPQASVDNGAEINPASNSASGVLTLGSSPTSGNMVVAMFGVGGDVAAASATPSGYTALTSQSNNYCHAGVFYHTSTTTAAITSSDLGQSVGNWGGIAFEMALAAAATVSLVPRRQKTYLRM
jgi:hypothetical protein